MKNVKQFLKMLFVCDGTQKLEAWPYGIYAPYIPLQTTPALVSPEEFVPCKKAPEFSLSIFVKNHMLVMTKPD